jgi:hypothetical protein
MSDVPQFTPETLAAFQAFYAAQEAAKVAPPKSHADKTLAEVHAEAKAHFADVARSADLGVLASFAAVIDKLVEAATPTPTPAAE